MWAACTLPGWVGEPMPSDADYEVATAALAAVADAPGLEEDIRAVLARGGYQMPGDTLPYETQAFWVADAVRAWLRGER